MNWRKIPYIGPRIESAQRALALRGYRPDMYDAEEAATWAGSGLDFERGLRRLNTVCEQLGFPKFDVSKTSVHWLLAACIEQRLQPKRILELGTFKGEYTVLLAHLYPDAEIVTIDLPGSDPLLKQLYGRKKMAAYEREVAKRETNLSYPNIKAVRCNSFFLLDVVQGPFDVVWVDAGHKFPDVAWDLCSAFHLVRPGGVVMADDVTRDMNFVTQNLGPDSEIVLRYIAERIPSPVRYFMKRRNESAYLYTKEHVAWLEKPSDWNPVIG